MTIVALDLETTGLDPDRHHIWEVGAVVRGHRNPAYSGSWEFLLRPNLAAADPGALRVGRYYERAARVLDPGPYAAWVVRRPAPLVSPGVPAPPPVMMHGATSRIEVARRLALILDGATIVGANPAFDAAFLTRYLRGHGHAPTWHHHLVDVVALAAGLLACCGDLPEPPWRTADMADRLGVVCPPELRHTAFGDADWALAIYDRVMTGQAGPCLTDDEWATALAVHDAIHPGAPGGA